MITKAIKQCLPFIQEGARDSFVYLARTITSKGKGAAAPPVNDFNPTRFYYTLTPSPRLAKRLSAEANVCEEYRNSGWLVCDTGTWRASYKTWEDFCQTARYPFGSADFAVIIGRDRDRYWLDLRIITTQP